MLRANNAERKAFLEKIRRLGVEFAQIEQAKCEKRAEKTLGDVNGREKAAMAFVSRNRAYKPVLSELQARFGGEFAGTKGELLVFLKHDFKLFPYTTGAFEVFYSLGMAYISHSIAVSDLEQAKEIVWEATVFNEAEKAEKQSLEARS